MKQQAVIPLVVVAVAVVGYFGYRHFTSEPLAIETAPAAVEIIEVIPPSEQILELVIEEEETEEVELDTIEEEVEEVETELEDGGNQVLNSDEAFAMFPTNEELKDMGVEVKEQPIVPNASQSWLDGATITTNPELFKDDWAAMGGDRTPVVMTEPGNNDKSFLDGVTFG